MVQTATPPHPVLRGEDGSVRRRFTESALTTVNQLMPSAEFPRWFAERRRAAAFEVARIPFARLDGWSFDDHTGNLGHVSGRFFTVEGIDVRTDYGAVGEWSQPIIHQPEVGILGILVKRIGGVPHFLMQAKAEPGNANTLQLSPTVQATRSNYTRVHAGSGIRYLEYFASPGHGRVLVDILQSEQGAWFYQKRNRNLIVETTADVPEHDDFCWLTLGQLKELLRADDIVNMEARNVLSCVPFAAPDETRFGDPFRRALVRSLATPEALHTTGEVISWITGARAGRELSVRRIPLDDVRGWQRLDDEIVDAHRRHFSVIAVAATAATREVRRWTQPLFAPSGRGIIAFLTRRVAGVLHVLVHARVEPGYLDVVELGPTVQCVPAAYDGLPPEGRPRYLDYVLSVPRERIRYEAVHSEEGGRFYHALSTYMIVEVEDDFPLIVPDDYRWLTVNQLTELLRHSRYLNIQSRSLLACLHSCW